MTALSLILFALLTADRPVVTRLSQEERPWTPLELAQYPPLIDLSTAERERTASLDRHRAKFPWLPTGTRPYRIADLRGLWLVRKRGMIAVGDVVATWRKQAWKAGKWYLVELTLGTRKSDGAWQWRTTRREDAKAFAAQWVSLPPVPVEYLPSVANNEVEP